MPSVSPLPSIFRQSASKAPACAPILAWLRPRLRREAPLSLSKGSAERCGSSATWMRRDSGGCRQPREQLHLSARAYHRVLKLVRTIADLPGAAAIGPAHLAEALQYRPRGCSRTPTCECGSEPVASQMEVRVYCRQRDTVTGWSNTHGSRFSFTRAAYCGAG